jgi:DNA-directed RNA polymerase subunit RPC12/RpoP
MLFCGAQVGWDKEREAQPKQNCELCGGRLLAESDVEDDPIDDPAFRIVVCAGCGRSRYDGSAAMDKAGRLGMVPADVKDAAHRTEAAVAPASPSQPTRRERRRQLYGGGT